MSTTVRISVPDSLNDEPQFERTIASISDAERTTLYKLIALLEKDAVNATNASSISLLCDCIVAASINATNATALNDLLVFIKAGTDVSSVVTAIDAL